MRCQQCGAEVVEQSVYCHKCGQRVGPPAAGPGALKPAEGAASASPADADRVIWEGTFSARRCTARSSPAPCFRSGFSWAVTTARERGADIIDFRTSPGMLIHGQR
jgi:hypothetical protein